MNQCASIDAPPVKTRGYKTDDPRQSNGFHESNRQIVDMWHKEEERRKKLYNDTRRKNAEKRAKK